MIQKVEVVFENCEEMVFKEWQIELFEAIKTGKKFELIDVVFYQAECRLILKNLSNKQKTRMAIKDITQIYVYDEKGKSVAYAPIWKGSYLNNENQQNFTEKEGENELLHIVIREESRV